MFTCLTWELDFEGGLLKFVLYVYNVGEFVVVFCSCRDSVPLQELRGARNDLKVVLRILLHAAIYINLQMPLSVVMYDVLYYMYVFFSCLLSQAAQQRADQWRRLKDTFVSQASACAGKFLVESNYSSRIPIISG